MYETNREEDNMYSEQNGVTLFLVTKPLMSHNAEGGVSRWK